MVLPSMICLHFAKHFGRYFRIIQTNESLTIELNVKTNKQKKEQFERFSNNTFLKNFRS